MHKVSRLPVPMQRRITLNRPAVRRTRSGSRSFNGATLVATLPANVTSWTDPSVNAANAYSVVAYNVAGNSLPGVSVVQAAAAAPVAPAAPTAAPTLAGPTGPAGLTQALNADGSMTLNWTAVAGATGYTVTITETTAAVPPVVTAPAVTVGVVAPATVPATTYTTAVLNAGSTYAFAVTATTLSGTTACIDGQLDQLANGCSCSIYGESGNCNWNDHLELGE